jgi:hypothetical protein
MLPSYSKRNKAIYISNVMKFHMVYFLVIFMLQIFM